MAVGSDNSKAAVAAHLAMVHYQIEPGMRDIFELESPSSQNGEETIRLLEVNGNSTGEGIYPLFFGAHPARGVPFPSVIVEVTPEEFEKIKLDPSQLPNGWRLGKRFDPPTAQ